VNRTFAGVAVGLTAVLAAIGLLTGDEAEPKGEAPEGTSVAQAARGVERVRELEFERLPRVKHVSGAQARRDGLRELDRGVTPRALATEESLLKLLGLIPPRASLRELLGKALSNEVGGYYVPRTQTLSIVGAGGALGLVGEVTLAHELTHALEDQHFGIDAGPATGFRRDRGVADSALREGTATVAMVDYLVRKQGGGKDIPASLRGRALKELADIALPASSGLPRYVREGLVFPYAAGAQLVNRIEGRGGWGAVDRAFGPDAPVSSEQIMHPRAYEGRERPRRVRVPSLASALPAGAERVGQGDIGEFDTEQLLREANGRALSRRAATGWGGGAFALWRLPGGRDVLAARWVWDTARDTREFERAAARTARALGGAAALGAGRTVALAVAPRRAEALARLALGG
jgi:hypothetical protein